MKPSVWIGIDIGTTGVRAVAYQADGQSLCAALITVELHCAGCEIILVRQNKEWQKNLASMPTT